MNIDKEAQCQARKAYWREQKKFMKVWIHESGMKATTDYFKRKAGTAAKITDHFMQRLYQRLDGQERTQVLVELTHLIKSGMHQYLFCLNETQSEIILNNNFFVAFARDKDRLVLKTIYKVNTKNA